MAMTRSQLLTTVQDILADILDNPKLALTEASKADDVSDWDSINHVKLLIALEKELNIRFASDEIQGLVNVGALIDLLEKKLS